MPILVLLLSFIGNYGIFHNKGELLTQESHVSYDEVIEYPGDTILNLTEFSSFDTFVFYFNTSLSYDDVYSLLSDTDNLYWESNFEVAPGVYADLSPLALFTYNFQQYNICLLRIGNIYAFAVINLANSYFNIVWCSQDLFFPQGAITTGFNVSLNSNYIGYYPDSNSFILPYLLDSNYIDSLKVFLYKSHIFISYTPYVEFIHHEYDNIYNFVIKQEINGVVYNMSFFDVSLYNTDQTFKRFQLPFLRIAFDSVFNILNFESSYVSSFILTSFTWMIQLLLLHVVVDTLAFIFKMYHKLMDKVV